VGQNDPVPSAPPPADLEAILARARAGDRDALRALFRAYQPRLLRFLRALEPRAADDLAGDVWLAVAGRIGRFEGGEAGFRAWLFAIARNRLADHRRRAARRPRLVPLDDAAPTAPDDPAATAIDQLSAQDAIGHLVAELSPDQTEVVLLRVVGGLSVQEVAALTGRTPGSVRVIQHRALKRLARTLPPTAVTR
jgi:RNA polymerase sigma-70 factor (ECF subfamily)